MASSAGDKTEKATPKRREEARKEGQVARSVEISTAMSILGGIAILIVWGPHMLDQIARDMVATFERIRDPGEQLTVNMAMEIFFRELTVLLVATAPFLVGMLVIGVLSNVVQVRPKITPTVIKPRLSKLNPINGFKQKFSVTSLFELAKNLFKIVVVGIPAVHSVWSHRVDILSLGAADPIYAGIVSMKLIVDIGLKVGAIYVVLAIADYAFQRHRHEKQLKMTKQEVKQEMRQQDMAPELKAQQRRRQREAARRRMLADVPTADVIITNPTHYSVALVYDPDDGAPKVVAKGVDLLALRIREIAEEAGVMRVENVPLARALYAQVEVGQVIPGDLFAAVAEILAFVYRTEKRTASERNRQRRLQHA